MSLEDFQEGARRIDAAYREHIERIAKFIEQPDLWRQWTAAVTVGSDGRLSPPIMPWLAAKVRKMGDE